MGKNDLPGAEAAFRKAIEVDPKYSEAHNALGGVLAMRNDALGAIAAYKAAIAADPKNSRPYSNLGKMLFEQGQLEEAITHLKQAVAVDPKDAVSHFNLGVMLDRKKDVEGAIAELKLAIAVNPKMWEAHHNLGAILAQREDWAGAIAAFKQAFHLNRQDKGARDNLRKLANEVGAKAWHLSTHPDAKHRDPHRAVALARLAVEAAPKDGRCRNALGVAHYRAGAWKEAVAELVTSIELHKGVAHYSDAINLFFLAMAHGKLGQRDEARKWYSQAVAWMGKYSLALAKNPQRAEALRRFQREAEEVLELKKK
jgi:superkiller protein 3